MIRITAKKPNFRRAGAAHPATPTEYPDDHFTAEQLQTLKEEPMLVVETFLDPPVIDPPPPPPPPNAIQSNAPIAPPSGQPESVGETNHDGGVAGDTRETPMPADVTASSAPVGDAVGGTEKAPKKK
jgi:hypothetical protein